MRSVRLLVVSVFLSLILFVPAVHASVSVVQNTSTHFTSSPGSQTFAMPVTSGNVVVAGILTYASDSDILSVTDSFGSSYTQAGKLLDVHADKTAGIYYATLSKGGSNTVTVTVGGDIGDLYIFEVAGATPPTVTTGSGSGVASSSVAASSTSFTSPAFLIAVVGFLDCGGTSGREMADITGFTYVPSPGGARTCSYLGYSDPVSSPTTFSGTIYEGEDIFSDNWVEVGAAFSASAGPLTPVGGVVTPANTVALVAPWLAVIALVGCVGTVVVVAKKRNR